MVVMWPASVPLSLAMMASASSAVWRCCASKSAGTYSASITGVIGSTFNRRTEPPEARESETAVSIADLARSVSARSTGTRIRLNMSLFPFIAESVRRNPVVDPNGWFRRPASVRDCGNPARRDETIEPAGLPVQLAPGIDRKIDHRQCGGRKLLVQPFARLDVAGRDQHAGGLLEAGIVADHQEPVDLGRDRADERQDGFGRCLVEPVGIGDLHGGRPSLDDRLGGLPGPF